MTSIDYSFICEVYGQRPCDVCEAYAQYVRNVLLYEDVISLEYKLSESQHTATSMRNIERIYNNVHSVGDDVGAYINEITVTFTDGGEILSEIYEGNSLCYIGTHDGKTYQVHDGKHVFYFDSFKEAYHVYWQAFEQK